MRALVFQPRHVIMAGLALMGAGAATPWAAVWSGAVSFPESEPVQYRPATVDLPESDGRILTVCATEVTQGQYEAVMGTNPSDTDYGDGPTLPVQNVSWLDAVDYLNRLSELEGLVPCYTRSGAEATWADHACPGWRLPTDVEWEYAARAGTTTEWSFGDEESRVDSYAWTDRNSGGKTHPVARLTPNDWALYDVHGNVREWVWDRTDNAPDSPTPVVTLSSASGPEQGQARVLRGGSFVNSPLSARSAYRSRDGPSSRDWNFGFRCVRGAAP